MKHPLMGKVLETVGYHNGFLFPAICYLYILYYGFRGYKVKRVATNNPTEKADSRVDNWMRPED